jgi:Arc/MetJ family transcription regulator
MPQYTWNIRLDGDLRIPARKAAFEHDTEVRAFVSDLLRRELKEKNTNKEGKR